MTSIDQFHLDFLPNDQYENTSSSTNLTSGISSSDTNHLNWPVLSLSILAVFGTFGNLLVCVSISFDKQLQTVTNWFLFSLAIADCLVSLIVLPLSIIKDFQGKNDEKKSILVHRIEIVLDFVSPIYLVGSVLIVFQRRNKKVT